MTGDDRVHPYFAVELAAALVEADQAMASPDYQRRTLTDVEDRALLVVDRLEFHGWKIEPSRQRRMQLDPATPATPPLPPL